MKKDRLTFDEMHDIWSETTRREEAVLLEMFLNCFQDKGIYISFNNYDEVDQMNNIIENVSEFASKSYIEDEGKDYEEVNKLIDDYLPLYTSYSLGDNIKDKKARDICMMIDVCNGVYFSLAN